MSEIRFYAGIGSRQTPTDIMTLMYNVAIFLGNTGWICRSGGADGADAAFERGAMKTDLQPHIYLPWEQFNGRIACRLTEPEVWTLPIAQTHHPRWENLGRPVRQIMCRNVHQVLGDQNSTTRSSFVLCWTPEASGSGGTGQAIRIAKTYGIPVFDLADSKVKSHIIERMNA